MPLPPLGDSAVGFVYFFRVYLVLQGVLQGALQFYRVYIFRLTFSLGLPRCCCAFVWEEAPGFEAPCFDFPAFSNCCARDSIASGGIELDLGLFFVLFFPLWEEPNVSLAVL